MTDKLKETVETAIQELKQVVTTLDFLRVWRGNAWEYSPMLPDQYLPLRNTIDWQVAYLKRALAEWTPDDTAYRPDGLSQEELLKMSSDCLMNGMAFMKAGRHVPVDEVINYKEDAEGLNQDPKEKQ